MHASDNCRYFIAYYRLYRLPTLIQSTRDLGVILDDYVTKGRFPLIPGMKRKEGYVVGEAAGDGVADVVEAGLSHSSQSPP